MTPDEVLQHLIDPGHRVPVDALAAADEHRSEVTDRLLLALERAIADPEGASAADGSLFSFALYLFAKWREPRAYPLVCRWLSLPGDAAFELGGDIVTQDGPRILAAVCDGDLDPIKALILSGDANDYGRSAGLYALSLVATWGDVPRDNIAEYFQWLADEGLERRPAHPWDALCGACADMAAVQVFPALRRAYAEELADPMYMAPTDLDDVERRVHDGIALVRWPRTEPITDVAEAIVWWAEFSENPRDWDAEDAFEDEGDDDEVHESDEIEPGMPGRSDKVGRNAPCPCGSGKKYKKCHGR